MVTAAADARIGKSFARDTGTAELAGLRSFLFLALDRRFPSVMQTLTRWILQSARSLLEHGCEGCDCLPVKVWTRSCFVYVDVGHAFRPQIVGELLAPFRRTGETDLFAIPTADHNRASRAHSLFRKLAQSASEFH